MIPYDDLQAMFENQALWRTRKAKEYPDDQRNAAAAGLLNKLAVQVELRAFNRGLLEQYSRLVEVAEIAVNVVEEEQQLIREVGFHFFPDSVDEFLEELFERIARQAWEEADPEARERALEFLRAASLRENSSITPDEKGPVS